METRMPFETGQAQRRRIAVIGGGISGLGAAHLLAEHHDMTLFEAEPRLGGHARTIHCGRDGDQPVDTGFIVFNKVNYPHLVRLFEKLDVPVTESNMSFGASLSGGALEYGLKDLGAVFTQPRNALDPRFLRMLRDIFRFNARALHTVREGDMTIGDLLRTLGTGAWFRDYYLLPLSGAIWSTPKQRILDFPAHAMVQFFENHALLSHTGQHQWYTVQGGSVAYVRRLQARLQRQRVELRTGCPVQSIRRGPAGPEVKVQGAGWDRFDEVVMATHSDDSLRMLADPSVDEARILGAIRYQPNRVVLHSDTAIMPRRRRCWSSWNYAEAAGRTGDTIDLTYWMNSLQPIPHDTPYFVTLNATRPIRDELVHDECTLRHPVYDVAALAAQREVARINGAQDTWFCGAWTRHGFHEDGLASGVEVARRILQDGAAMTPHVMAAE